MSAAGAGFVSVGQGSRIERGGRRRLAREKRLGRKGRLGKGGDGRGEARGGAGATVGVLGKGRHQLRWQL